MSENTDKSKFKQIFNKGNKEELIDGENIDSAKKFANFIDKVGEIPIEKLNLIAEKIPHFNELAKDYFDKIDKFGQRNHEILKEQNEYFLKRLETVTDKEEKAEIIRELHEIRKESINLAKWFSNKAEKVAVGGIAVIGVVIAAVIKKR